MGSEREREVVRLVAQATRTGAVRRIRVRYRASAAAGRVLARLLARVAVERREGRTVRIERAPADLRRLITVCGLAGLLRR